MQPAAAVGGGYYTFAIVNGANGSPETLNNAITGTTTGALLSLTQNAYGGGNGGEGVNATAGTGGAGS